MTQYLTKSEIFNDQALSSWHSIFRDSRVDAALDSAFQHVNERHARGITIFPPKNEIFNAFKLSNLKEIRAVILGQDPYHGSNQAHGLCFSVQDGVALPPSLKNIYQEIQNDIQCSMPQRGNLTHWASQGVFLLNTVLTVESGQAHSHKNIGWEILTDSIIKAISEHNSHVVFMLWGSHAQKKEQLIDTNKHTLLCAPHPSPLSAHRGFFGCRHFSQCNAALLAHGQPLVDWVLPSSERE
ncbi:MAG: uracil-DNA glycosylase [Pseudomonadota bacterium]